MSETRELKARGSLSGAMDEFEKSLARSFERRAGQMMEGKQAGSSASRIHPSSEKDSQGTSLAIASSCTAALEEPDMLCAALYIDEGGGWLVGFWLASASEREGWSLVEFLVRPWGAGTLSPSVLRGLPIGGLLAEARGLATAYRSSKGRSRAPQGIDHLLQELEPWLSPWASGKRQSRDDAAFAGLAYCYWRLTTAGVRSPAKVLAEALGSTPSAVTNRISIARRMGMLTSAIPGAPGGDITEKAWQQLGSPSREG